MSLDATRWAWQARGIRPAQKLILLSLADRSDEHHTCYPSIARLSSDTGLDRKTILKALSEMESAGLISINRERGGGNTYALVGVECRHAASAETVASPKNGTSTSNGTWPVPKTGHDQSQKRDTNLPLTYQEPDLVPTVHSRLASPKRPAVPVQAIIDAYHELLPMCPQVRKLTETRRRQIEARWRAGDLPDVETWRDYFEFCAQSKFLTGLAPAGPGQRPFVADLEWLSREGNYAKVYERKYHR